jgi:hypothetical protein
MQHEQAQEENPKKDNALSIFEIVPIVNDDPGEKKIMATSIVR